MVANVLYVATQDYLIGHFVARSQGGLGIEENIVTLCLDCHNDYDNGNKKDEYRNYIRNYLKSIYGDSWSEENLVYNKWSNFKFQ